MSTKIVDYEISGPLPPLEGLERYDSLRVHLFRGERAIGKLTLRTGRRPIKPEVLVEQIAQHCLNELLTEGVGYSYEQVAELVVNELIPNNKEPRRHSDAENNYKEAARVQFKNSKLETRNLEHDFRTTLSIIIPTCDRPKELEQCLISLLALKSRHPFEIVVSDNRPASGLSEPVARRFPVKYVAEPRPGASYARNAGVAHSSGEILVFTDDDVKVTPNWLDNLVAPFVEPDVMCVSGLVLPVELETSSQEIFETYGAGALERGFERRKLGQEFFWKWKGAVQTWQLGGTANCAIRAEVFTRPEMGPFDESLGPGTPAGVGEDTYMFYRILKAKYSCVYEPAALVYHRHRQDMPGLRKQLFSYSKGAVAQQLRIWLTDKDRRALVQIVRMLPQWQYRRLRSRIFGWNRFPLHVILMEIWGNLLGVPGFIQSIQLVKKQGRITAAQIAAQRAQAGPLLNVNVPKEEQIPV